MRVQTLPWLFAIMMALVNCKQKPASAIQSLDHLAMGVEQRNFCSAEPENLQHPDYNLLADRVHYLGTTDPETEDFLVQEAQKTLTAIPTHDQRKFRDLGGQIVITEHAPTICIGDIVERVSEATDRARERYLEGLKTALATIESCYVAVPPGDKPEDEQLVAIYVKPDANAEIIRHSIVKSFAYFWVERLLHLERRPDSRHLFDIKNGVQSRGQRRILPVIDAFVADLETMPKAEKALDTYRPLATGGSAKNEDRVVAAHNILAHTYDSLVCNTWDEGPFNTVRNAAPFVRTIAHFRTLTGMSLSLQQNDDETPYNSSPEVPSSYGQVAGPSGPAPQQNNRPRVRINGRLVTPPESYQGGSTGYPALAFVGGYYTGLGRAAWNLVGGANIQRAITEEDLTGFQRAKEGAIGVGKAGLTLIPVGRGAVSAGRGVIGAGRQVVRAAGSGIGSAIRRAPAAIRAGSKVRPPTPPSQTAWMRTRPPLTTEQLAARRSLSTAIDHLLKAKRAMDDALLTGNARVIKWAQSNYARMQQRVSEVRQASQIADRAARGQPF